MSLSEDIKEQYGKRMDDEEYNAVTHLASVVYKLCVQQEHVVEALNFLGLQSQTHTDQMTQVVNMVSGFGQQMSSMGPTELLKMAVGGRKKNKGEVTDG